MVNLKSVILTDNIAFSAVDNELRLHVDLVDATLNVIITREGLMIDLVSDNEVGGSRQEQWDQIATDLQEKHDGRTV